MRPRQFNRHRLLFFVREIKPTYRLQITPKSLFRPDLLPLRRALIPCVDVLINSLTISRNT